MGRTLPEDVLGIPLYIPGPHDYFDIEASGMPNGDACLVIDGDTSTSYKAIITAPTMSVDICNSGEMHTGRQWAMSCWLKMSALGSVIDGAVMLGCKAYTATAVGNSRNYGVPFQLGAGNDAHEWQWFREPLNNIASPPGSTCIFHQGSFLQYHDYWFLLVINNIVTGAYTVTSTVYMDLQPTAQSTDTASGSATTGTLTAKRFLHIGNVGTTGVGRAGIWRIGKWAFHDHALSTAERQTMWQAMMATSPTIHTDDFNRSTLDSLWVSITGIIPILDSNQLFASQAVNPTTVRAMMYTPTLHSSNMYAQIDVVEIGYDAFPMVRVGAYGANTYYAGGFTALGGPLWVINKGTTIVASTAAVAPSYPHTVRLEVTTNVSDQAVISLYSDGILRLSYTDTTSPYLTQTHAGIRLRTSNTGSDHTRADNFECGTL